MRTVDSAFSDNLQTDLTTLCNIVEITTRLNPITYYLTDHTEDVYANGHRYRSDQGFDISAVELAVGNSGHTATFTLLIGPDNLITRAALHNGKFDLARVRASICDYSLSGSYFARSTAHVPVMPVFGGYVTDIGFGDLTTAVFTVATPLGQDIPLSADKYSPTCRYDFGDSRCGVDIVPTNDRPRVLAQIDGQTFTCTIGEQSPDGYYNNGTAVFFNGPAAGLGFEILSFVNDGVNPCVVTLKVDIPTEDVSGSLVNLYGGCDKFLLTGCAYWNNTKRFGGEPFQTRAVLGSVGAVTSGVVDSGVAVTPLSAVTGTDQGTTPLGLASDPVAPTSPPTTLVLTPDTSNVAPY